ncbi:MAG: hypothetical protein U0936_25365 [Planctomycetaceae bacterium]
MKDPSFELLELMMERRGAVLSYSDPPVPRHEDATLSASAANISSGTARSFGDLIAF